MDRPRVPKREFPNIRDTFLGVPIIRIIVFWGLCCIIGTYEDPSQYNHHNPLESL